MSEVINSNIIKERLTALGNEEYRNKLIEQNPQLSQETIIGVRVNDLTRYAKELAAQAEADFDRLMELRAYLTTLPHQYLDENNLHMILLSLIPDFQKCLWYMDMFLPHVNSCTTTDLQLPKIFGESHYILFPAARRWSWDPQPYTCRYGLRLLRELYMDKWFYDRELDSVARTESTYDFVNDMAAAYMVDALRYHWDLAIQVLEDRRLTPEIHALTLQKVAKTRRQFTADQKKYIKSLTWDYYRPFPHWYQIDPVLPSKEWWWITKEA